MRLSSQQDLWSVYPHFTYSSPQEQPTIMNWYLKFHPPSAQKSGAENNKQLLLSQMRCILCTPCSFELFIHTNLYHGLGRQPARLSALVPNPYIDLTLNPETLCCSLMKPPWPYPLSQRFPFPLFPSHHSSFLPFLKRKMKHNILELSSIEFLHLNLVLWILQAVMSSRGHALVVGASWGVRTDRPSLRN